MALRIKHVMPADSWFALRWSKFPPYYSLDRLISFVILEGEQGDKLDAINQHETLVRHQDDFGGYHHADEINDAFRDRCGTRGKARLGDADG